MMYVAFTLGLFGSLHCLGMCGPLAFAFLPGIQTAGMRYSLQILYYNLGRVISYGILGLLTGLFANALTLTGIQKPLTLALGIIMIVLFLLSMDLEQTLMSSNGFKKLHDKYRKLLAEGLQKVEKMNPIFLGMLNGLIPCGLVYLALAGAISTGNLYSNVLFMMVFGLGTIPLMFALLAGVSMLRIKKVLKLKKVFAYLQLLVGCILVYRALAIDLPTNLELYWSMGKIMCH